MTTYPKKLNMIEVQQCVYVTQIPLTNFSCQYEWVVCNECSRSTLSSWIITLLLQLILIFRRRETNLISEKIPALKYFLYSYNRIFINLIFILIIFRSQSLAGHRKTLWQLRGLAWPGEDRRSKQLKTQIWNENPKSKLKIQTQLNKLWYL